MNSLSWMIYAADVLGALGIITGAVGLLGIVGWVILSAVVFVGEVDGSWDEEELKALRRFARSIFLVAAPSLLLAVIIPKPTTIYAIAASEMGEEVLDSPTGSKAVKALDAWLDRQIEGDDE